MILLANMRLLLNIIFMEFIRLEKKRAFIKIQIFFSGEKFPDNF